jgi:hypothetical protein
MSWQKVKNDSFFGDRKFVGSIYFGKALRNWILANDGSKSGLWGIGEYSGVSENMFSPAN